MSMASLPVQRCPESYMTPKDYEAIEGAVMETVRGRWFLMEFARRNRAQELGQMRDALSRLEKAVLARSEAHAEPAVPAAELTPLEIVPPKEAPPPLAAVIMPFTSSPPPSRPAICLEALSPFDAMPVDQKMALFG